MTQPGCCSGCSRQQKQVAEPRMIQILNLLALSFQSQGDTDRAINTLERALSLAERGGFIRIFVDEGPPMARLLPIRKPLSRGIAPDYVRPVVGGIPHRRTGADGSTKSQFQDPIWLNP